MRDLIERGQLARYGIHMLDTAVYALDAWRDDLAVAMDAQPQLVTTANSGIPAFLSQIVDSEVIDVVLAPLRAAEIVGGEVKKGDWTTQSLMMPLAESVGHVVSYGDYDNGGQVDMNVSWVPRQPYYYQTIKRVGDREQAMWGAAQIDNNARKDMAVVETFARFQNRSYFFGISGIQNYGLLNDPSLITPITPGTKAGGGTSWANATAEEIYRDILALYTQLQVQMGGNLEMTDNMILTLSTTRQSKLSTISALTLVSVMVAIKANFPNLTIRVAPEYTTGSGELMQLSVTSYRGQQTAWAGFTEKLRAHNVVTELSAFAQKFSAGTWGTIIRRPIAIAQMLGL